MKKIKVAVIGPGNIGSDLMYKILNSDRLEMALLTGIVESEGIKRARDMGINTSIEGVDAVLKDPDIKIVFDATGAKPHSTHAPLLKQAGKVAIDLTPAAIGPYVVPCVNLDQLKDEPNLNMVTCAGQATVPIVSAIHQGAGVKYAEIVASISSKSAGPGTRQNIDEFTETTSRAIVEVGGAKTGKAIIILNPAEPPVLMCNTVYVEVENPDETAIKDAVHGIVKEIQKYVPGYRLRVPPILEGHKVTTIIEVEGAGDFLPKYSGNLDIITSAAVRVAGKIAEKLLAKGVQA
ncbi:acetaldehyde dehydrogenase (acetylating) [Acididesulfobacillus acetoxydans]|uniref:Acetaldehyde dehydrogenase n=1 Tax=Acididesulfobacillus acetoxydans TaxID=1561005 RepID=A0A8S0WXF1_9FIRM|nr:acetaldehyde dehydrogenase (acetylating) [Acididesulfobacillus acetoxydans]CAA7600921.1 acetaldehyde dehydrogenase (acetylating) [Acididesulfobacillus acetoxydans]CEJ08922.1 Acetaldehyde dehydrogenase [Acididesulfobacillus acetoxydans]